MKNSRIFSTALPVGPSRIVLPLRRFWVFRFALRRSMPAAQLKKLSAAARAGSLPLSTSRFKLRSFRRCRVTEALEGWRITLPELVSSNRHFSQVIPCCSGNNCVFLFSVNPSASSRFSISDKQIFKCSFSGYMRIKSSIYRA